jgi:hypothetical protein
MPAVLALIGSRKEILQDALCPCRKSAHPEQAAVIEEERGWRNVVKNIIHSGMKMEK